MQQAITSVNVDSLLATAASEEVKWREAHARGDHKVAHLHEKSMRNFLDEALKADTVH